MNSRLLRLRKFYALLLAGAALHGPATSIGHAQAVRPASSAQATDTQVPANDEVITLNPFDVIADRNDSYEAINTNSVTRFSAELAKLPVSADVFTSTFLEDVAAVSIEEMVVAYGTGTGVGGNDAAGTSDSGRPGDRASNVNVKIRGLDAGSMRVNSFGEGGIDDTFTTERVEIVRGPQSLLNGGVGGGGVVNAVTKQARFNSRMGRVQFRTDDNGSRRGVVDYGFGTKRFAIRFSGLLDDTLYSRVFLRARSQGAYLQGAVLVTQHTTVRFEASFKDTENVLSTINTSLSAPAVGSGASRLEADPRNGQRLRALYALGKADDILGGRLNWGNIDSIKGAHFGQHRDNQHYEVSLEQRLGRFGRLQLAAMRDINYMDRAESNNFTNLVAPLRNNNPYNDYAIGFRPGNTFEGNLRRGYRANLTTEFSLFGGRARTQALLGATYENLYNKRRSQKYWLADADGKIVVNQAQVTNSNLGRTEIPLQWFALNEGPVKYFPFERDAGMINVNGTNYVRDENVFVGMVTPTPTNPRGVIGSGSYWDQYGYNDSYFAAASTDWFGDRFTTLAGYRINNVEAKRYQATDVKRMQASPKSLNLGGNVKLNRFLRAYYGYSNSFNPPSIVQFGPIGEVTQPSKGIGHEFGLKFVPQTGFISGSISYYTVDSEDELTNITSGLREDINPIGINGRLTPEGSWINVDRHSEGAELILTAQPSRNWRARVGLAVTDGTIGESKTYRVLYNDEFHTNSSGGLTYGDGTPLMVADDPTKNAVPNTPRSQLTIARMNNPTDPYFAVLDPDSGKITNAAALQLLTASPTTGAPVGTGRLGLPISAHQLRFTDPNQNGGIIVVTEQGEPTSGYSKYSANLTSSYTFTEGRIKGLTIGGTAFYRKDDRSYLYTQVIRDAAGAVTGSERRLFSFPDSFRLNAIVSYRRSLSKSVEFTTQVNIDNLFNHYDVAVLPNPSNGDPRTARFTFEPRTYVWTNTFSF